MSHTATIAADYAHEGALESAVKKLGGRLLGRGRHRLFDSVREGMGIALPGWTYPIVAQADGTLAYDDFNGLWGNVADLDKLHEEYSWELVELAAQNLGWQTERTADAVTVYHPSGATITVSSTQIDLNGFVGGACSEALRQLALPVEHVQAKPTIGQSVNQCQEGC